MKKLLPFLFVLFLVSFIFAQGTTYYFHNHSFLTTTSDTTSGTSSSCSLNVKTAVGYFTARLIWDSTGTESSSTATDTLNLQYIPYIDSLQTHRYIGTWRNADLSTDGLTWSTLVNPEDNAVYQVRFTHLPICDGVVIRSYFATDSVISTTKLYILWQ